MPIPGLYTKITKVFTAQTSAATSGDLPIQSSKKLVLAIRRVSGTGSCDLDYYLGIPDGATPAYSAATQVHSGFASDTLTFYPVQMSGRDLATDGAAQLAIYMKIGLSNFSGAAGFDVWLLQQ